MKKILINFVSVGNYGIDIPRLLKFKALESQGCKLNLFSGTFLKSISLADGDVYSLSETIPEFKPVSGKRWTKLGYMLHCLTMNIRGLLYIPRIIKDKYDVIYSPAAVLDLVIIPYIVKLFDKKIIWVSVLDNTVPFTEPGNRFIRFLAWLFFGTSLLMLRRADIIFVVTEDLREFMQKNGFDAKKIVLTGNGIENGLIERAEAGEKYKSDALFMGRINEAKGIYDMLKVLEIVKQKYPNFRFTIIGDGDEKTVGEFKNKIRKTSLENNVRLLGYRAGLDKFNIIKSSKSFLFLSFRESFGTSLLEAVCCGLPAFAYNLPEFSKIYVNGEVDISLKGDWKTVAEKVIRLFEKGDFTNEKGKLLLGKYSWERIAKIEYNAMNKLFKDD